MAALVDLSLPRHDRRMADAVITAPLEREPHWRAIWRNAFPFLVVGLVWEAVARAQVFPARLFPPLEAIGATFWRLTLSGIFPNHVLDTLVRLAAGFALAGVVGVVLGILIGRSR